MREFIHVLMSCLADSAVIARQAICTCVSWFTEGSWACVGVPAALQKGRLLQNS